jgi:hypothetical protein
LLRAVTYLKGYPEGTTLRWFRLVRIRKKRQQENKHEVLFS